jgi:hypothetical protein
MGQLPLAEATLASLYDSAVQAFPRTLKRQHAVDPVRIVGLEWTPFLGLRTLLVRGRAVNERREYKPIVLFKGVNYLEEGGVPLVASDGRLYHLNRLTYDGNEVLVRCSCPDFHWRFNWYDHLDQSLYGRRRGPYEAKTAVKANPLEMPGMCKHVMKMGMALRDSGLLTS